LVGWLVGWLVSFFNILTVFIKAQEVKKVPRVFIVFLLDSVYDLTFTQNETKFSRVSNVTIWSSEQVNLRANFWKYI
jgi:hypothetical protein